MKDKLINDILETGKQISQNKLETLDIESLQMILTLRREYAK